MKKRNNSNLDFDKHPIAANEGGILVHLLRSLITKKNYQGKLGYFIDRYGNKANKNTSSYAKVKSKSTVINNLISPSITFKVFIDLLKNLFNVKNLTIIVEAEFPDGQKTSSHVTFTMDDIVKDEKESEGENNDNREHSQTP